jgi:hypothetical protein
VSPLIFGLIFGLIFIFGFVVILGLIYIFGLRSALLCFSACRAQHASPSAGQLALAVACSCCLPTSAKQGKHVLTHMCYLCYCRFTSCLPRTPSKR